MLEFAEHGSLQSFVQTHEFNITQLLTMAGEICDGLAYLHARHYIHRDIAARNVLVSSSFQCKVSGKNNFNFYKRR